MRKGIGMLLIIGLACSLLGCASSETKDASATPLPKSPDKTAEQNRQSLEHANMPPEAKAVLGGNSGGGGGQGAQ